MSDDLVMRWYERSKSDPGEVPDQPQQDADGTASLYYYDQARSLAFHWTGRAGHKIEVSQGGDHEDPVWAFDPPTEPLGSFGFHGHVMAFQMACEVWISQVEWSK